MIEGIEGNGVNEKVEECEDERADDGLVARAGQRNGSSFSSDDLRETALRLGCRRPNLFLVGAPRCGTSSLHYFLGGHPSVFMSKLKEPGYFVPELDTHPKDPEWYLRLFDEAGESIFVGESSTHYAKLPLYRGVPERIARSCDDPRFLYLMRDPIDRAISHYWHNTEQSAEFRPPLRAIREDSHYRDFGDYSRQLTPYFQLYGRDAVFVETFERMISDPKGVTSDIYRWLGLDPGKASAEFPTRNATSSKIEYFQGIQRLGHFLHHSQVWRRLSPLVPQFVKDVGKSIMHKTIDPTEERLEQVKEFLRPWAEDVVDRTSQLLERDFPEWSTTNSTTGP